MSLLLKLGLIRNLIEANIGQAKVIKTIKLKIQELFTMY